MDRTVELHVEAKVSPEIWRNMESELWEKARLLLEELNTGMNNIDSKVEEDKQLITNEAD